MITLYCVIWYSPYGLPGDIPEPFATNFGFKSRGVVSPGVYGRGDGDGQIFGGIGVSLRNQAAGETVMFWVDLSAARLIKEHFNTASASAFTSPGGNISSSTTPSIDAYFPKAAIGRNGYIWVLGGARFCGDSNCPGGHYNSYEIEGVNYFFLTTLSISGGNVSTGRALTPAESLSIDRKLDDGLPFAGKIRPIIHNDGDLSTAPESTYPWNPNPSTMSINGSATTCYDNNGHLNTSTTVIAATKYSMGFNNGTGVNCGLSFKFQ